MVVFKLDDKQSQTLQAIFEDPVRSDIHWSHLKELFVALGGLVKEDHDRLYIVVKSHVSTTRAVIHCRHPDLCASTHAVSSIQKLLKSLKTVGVK
ncbi:hypothetical protein IFO70_33400 [Phormidium tenue FACHB-886]|nr:hypothetical protein [Phormidium tenue FACHB-886]